MTGMRKMEFVLTGCPRSGTTAAAAYLRAVDSVYCAHEAFRAEEDHSALNMPDDLISALREKSSHLIERREKNPVHRAYHGSFLDLQERAADIKYFGNKTPRYIFRLDQIVQEIARPRAIVTIREIEPVAISYARRAEDDRDRWRPGRTGAFAVGDLLVLLNVLDAMRGEDVLIFPSRILRDDWSTGLAAMMDFIAPGIAYSVSDSAIAALDEYKVRRKRKVDNTEIALAPVEQRMIEQVTSAGYEDIFMKPEPFRLSEVKDDLAALLTRLPDPLSFLEASLKDHPIPETQDFLRFWRKGATTTMKRLAAGQA